MIPLAIGSLILGGAQAAAGLYGLSQVAKDPYPEYKVAPEAQAAYNTAQEQAKFGYAPEQKAAFGQDMARSSNTRFRRAVDMGGGNLAYALHAGINAGNLGAMNNFYAQDAQLQNQKQRYVGQLAQGFQSNQNMNTRSAIQSRDAIEQAYGNSIQAGLNNAVGSLNLTQAMGAFKDASMQPIGINQGSQLNANNHMLKQSSWNPNYGSGNMISQPGNMMMQPAVNQFDPSFGISGWGNQGGMNQYLPI